jgi:hypothetical protein
MINLSEGSITCHIVILNTRFWIKQGGAVLMAPSAHHGSPHGPQSVWVIHQAGGETLTQNVRTTSSRGLNFSQNLFRLPSGFATYNQGSCLSAPDVHSKTLHLEDSEICHPSKVWHFINICNYYVLPEGHWLCIAIIFIGIGIKIHTYPWLSQERRVLSMIWFWTQLDFIWVKSLHNFEFSLDIWLILSFSALDQSLLIPD